MLDTCIVTKKEMFISCENDKAGSKIKTARMWSDHLRSPKEIILSFSFEHNSKELQ